MKKQHVLLISMLGCTLAAPAWAAESPKTEKASEELRAVLKQHHDAMNKQDLKALLALYADTPDVALMGTGPGEFWKGRVAVEDTYKHYFETFKAAVAGPIGPVVVAGSTAAAVIGTGTVAGSTAAAATATAVAAGSTAVAAVAAGSTATAAAAPPGPTAIN